MKHSDFRIGTEFRCGGNRWRCTDIGMRTIIAIRISGRAEAAGWLVGPPYGVPEIVFDEYDIEACRPSS